MDKLPEGFVWEYETKKAAPSLPEGFVWEDEPQIPLPKDMEHPEAMEKKAQESNRLSRFVDAATKGFSKGFGKKPVFDEKPTEYFPPSYAPAVTNAYNHIANTLIDSGEGVLRSIGGLIRAGTHTIAQAAQEMGMSEGDASRLERDLMGMIDTAGIMTVGTNMATQGARSINKAHRQANRIKEVEAFDSLNVKPFAPALTDSGLEAATKGVSNIPFAGKPIENALIDTVSGANRSAVKIASELSDVKEPYQLGEMVQGSLKRYRSLSTSDVPIETMNDSAINTIVKSPSRLSSFSTKQEALYETAWRKMPARFKSNGAKNPDLVPTQNAKIALKNIERIQDQIGVSGGALQGKFSGMADKLKSRGNYTIETLRHMRTEVGRMLSRGSDDAVNMDRTQLKQLYGAITEDIKGGLARIAQRAAQDPQISNADTVAAFSALKAFENADKFTKLGMVRMDNLLSLTRASRPEEAANRILRSILDGGKGNLNLLSSAKKTLRNEEWNDFVGLTIRQMGKPKPSARGVADEVGFSVESFTTKWNSISPSAKNLMFAGQNKNIKKAIDDLVLVAGRLANFESYANRSNSATNIIGAAGVMGGGNALLGLSATSLLKMFAVPYGFSKIVSSPKLARWMARTAELSTRPNFERVWAAQLSQLQMMADKDPEMVPLLELLENGGQSLNP